VRDAYPELAATSRDRNPVSRRLRGAGQRSPPGIAVGRPVSLTRTAACVPSAHGLQPGSKPTMWGAARYVAVDGDIICDFSDYSRLHGIVYQEIIAGRGYRIEDAAGAVKLAERVRQVAEAERAAAH